MEQENPSNSENELSTEQKIRFSIKMRDSALDSAARRQVYEWKFCIMMWTGIGGLIGVILVNKLVLDLEIITPARILVLGVLTIVIVIWFQVWCWLANKVDKKRAEMYEDIINDDLGITEENKREFNEAVNRIKKMHGFWAPAAQIAVTATLLWAFGCIYSAIPSETEKRCDNDKRTITAETRQCLCNLPQRKCKPQRNKSNHRHMRCDLRQSKRDLSRSRRDLRQSKRDLWQCKVTLSHCRFT